MGRYVHGGLESRSCIPHKCVWSYELGLKKRRRPGPWKQLTTGREINDRNHKLAWELQTEATSSFPTIWRPIPQEKEKGKLAVDWPSCLGPASMQRQRRREERGRKGKERTVLALTLSSLLRGATGGGVDTNCLLLQGEWEDAQLPLWLSPGQRNVAEAMTSAPGLALKHANQFSFLLPSWWPLGDPRRQWSPPGMKESSVEDPSCAPSGLPEGKKVSSVPATPSWALSCLIHTRQDRVLQIGLFSQSALASEASGEVGEKSLSCSSLIFLANQVSCWPAQPVVAARAMASSWNF